MKRSTARAEEKEVLLDFRKMGAIVRKNFIVMTRDPIRLIPLLVFPIIMILVFGYISGNTPKHISTAIVPYDNSELSQDIQQEISNSETFTVNHVVSTEDEARRLLDEGKVRVIVVIPANFEDNVKRGVQQGITVIVDESDSSVAATSKQGLMGIISKVSSKISIQKITSFQHSVGTATMKLQQDDRSHVNLYGPIAEKLAPAEVYMNSEKKMSDQEVKALLASSTSLHLYAPYHDTTLLDENNTWQATPIGYDAQEAQKGAAMQSSYLMGSAISEVHAATMVARQADSQAISAASYNNYKKNVAAPLQTINVFTQYDANSMLTPVVYEEKAAYGTGKRAIDFVIPSIIALTIFQGAVMGMGRSIAGEKKDGSLTRVFLTPTSNVTIIIGTLSFYTLFETIRATFLIIISIIFFNIKIEGSLLLIGLIILIYASISVALGMAISSMVKTEQQFMAMAMLISMPSMFLAGALFPLQAMPKFMQVLAQFLPVTYAGDALRGVMIKGFSIGYIIYPLAVLLLFLAIVLGIVFMVFKRDIE